VAETKNTSKHINYSFNYVIKRDMINYTVMLKKSTFGETSNKFIKGSPIQWYTSQEGEEWH
jgi:uncharacterized protein (UPF0333 family)